MSISIAISILLLRIVVTILLALKPLFRRSSVKRIIRLQRENQFRYRRYSDPIANGIARDVNKLHRRLQSAFHGDMDWLEIFITPIVKQPIVLTQLNNQYLVEQNRRRLWLAIYWAKQGKGHSPQGWTPAQFSTLFEYVTDFIQHLFESYDLPEVIRWRWVGVAQESMARFSVGTKDTVWQEAIKDHSGIRLYLLMAEGKSIRDADFLPFRISKRAMRFLPEVYQGTDLAGIYWWTSFRSLGGDKDRAHAISRIGEAFDHLHFWRQFIQIAARTNKEYSPDELMDLIDWIKLVKFGNGSLADYEEYREWATCLPNIDLKNQTLASLQRQLDEQIHLRYPAVEGRPDRSLVKDETGQEFVIIRLVDYPALREEGNWMDHCVGSRDYDIDCRNGNSSIWSLRSVSGETRFATFELEGEKVVEVSGPGNNSIPVSQINLIEQWRTQAVTV